MSDGNVYAIKIKSMHLQLLFAKLITVLNMFNIKYDIFIDIFSAILCQPAPGYKLLNICVYCLLFIFTYSDIWWMALMWQEMLPISWAHDSYAFLLVSIFSLQCLFCPNWLSMIVWLVYILMYKASTKYIEQNSKRISAYLLTLYTYSHAWY